MNARVKHILISVDHHHAMNMLSGIKTAELRRRPLRIEPGTRIWIYSKLPQGRVELTAIAEEVVAAPPKQLWTQFGKLMGITFCEFQDYCRGTDTACVIRLREIEPLTQPPNLVAMRRFSKNFQPPQFFKRLPQNGRELGLFVDS